MNTSSADLNWYPLRITYSRELALKNYLDSKQIENINLKRGQRVRITGGVFEGVEGEFVRIKDDRRVVVVIQGLMAVATAFIHPSLIEQI